MAGSTFVAEFEQACQWLNAEWALTGEVWSDRVRSEFEGDYWGPLTRAASAFLDQMRELDAVLESIRSSVP